MVCEEYFSTEEIVKKFNRKDCWNIYSNSDIFYICQKKAKGLLTFVDQFFGDSYGIQLFFTKEGFNYVHDIFTIEQDSALTLFDCDSICLIVVNKNDLKEEEKKFLLKNKIKIKNKYNILFYRFEPGYDFRLCNNKEIKIMYDYLEILSSLISNEELDLLSAFSVNRVCLAFADKEKKEYSVSYVPLPYLEHNYKKNKVDIGFVEEFKNRSYINDECYIFASYAPLIVNETKTRPMILYFYYPKSNRSYFKYLIGDLKDYNEKFFTSLYDSFNEVGIPEKIYFNNRKLYAYSFNTLKALKIECEFLREERHVDQNMNDLLSNLYNEAPSEYVENEDVINLLMSSITKTLNEMYDINEENYDKPKNDEFIS